MFLLFWHIIIRDGLTRLREGDRGRDDYRLIEGRSGPYSLCPISVPSAAWDRALPRASPNPDPRLGPWEAAPAFHWRLAAAKALGAILAIGRKMGKASRLRRCRVRTAA